MSQRTYMINNMFITKNIEEFRFCLYRMSKKSFIFINVVKKKISVWIS